MKIMVCPWWHILLLKSTLRVRCCDNTVFSDLDVIDLNLPAGDSLTVVEGSCHLMENKEEDRER